MSKNPKDAVVAETVNSVGFSTLLSVLDYHLELACGLGLLKTTDYRPLSEAVVEVKRMLSSLIDRVEEQRDRTRGASAYLLLTTDY